VYQNVREMASPCISQGHMRHFGDLSQDLERGFKAQRMMGSQGVIKEQVIGQSLMEEGFIVDDVEVVIDELFLDGAVVAFDEGVDFRAVGVGEGVRDALGFEVGVEFAQVFWAVVGLPMFDGEGVDGFKAGVEVLHVAGGEGLVVQGEGKFEFGVDGGEEVIFAFIGPALNGIGEDVAEVLGFGRVSRSQSFLTMRAGMIGVVVDLAGRLEEEMVAFDDVADGGGRDGLKSVLMTERVEEYFDLVFAEFGVFFSPMADEVDHLWRHGGGSDFMRTGGGGNQGGELAAFLPEPLLPAGEYPPVSPEGFLGSLFTVLFVEIDDFHALFGDFRLVELSKALEHIIGPPKAINFIKQTPYLHGVTSKP